MTRSFDTTPHQGVEDGAEPGSELGSNDGVRGHDRRAVALGSLLGVAALLVMALPRIGSTPLWIDEAYSLGVANQFAYGVKETGGTMFLYYALLWPWARVAQSTEWIRSLSLLVAVLAIPMFALLADRVGGRRAALLAPPLLGASFFFPVVATDARSYTIESFILIVGWYALVRAIEAGTDTPEAHRWWVLFTVIGPFGVLAHGLFPIFTATWCLAAVLSPQPRRAVVKLLPMLGATVVFLGLLFALGISAVGDWVPPSSFQYVKVATFQYIGTYHSLQVVTLVCTAMLAWGAIRAWRGSRALAPGGPGRVDAWRMCIPLIWALLPPVLLLVISFARSTFVSRYLSAIAPGIALVVAIGLGAAVDAVAERRGGVCRDARRMASFGVVGALLVAAFGLTNYRAMGSTYSQEWDKLVATLVRESRPSDGILMYSDLSRPAIEAELAQVDHGPMPRILDMERQFGRPLRVDLHLSPSYANRRRLVLYERIWTVTVGSEEIESAFYARSAPLATNFRMAGSWKFDTGFSTVLRLYTRVTPVDFYPTIS